MMESAEHEMLRSLGISVLPKPVDGQHPISWPRVAANCNYLSAARFEDVLRIDVHVAKIGSSSVRYEFRFLRDPVPELADRPNVAGSPDRHQDSAGSAPSDGVLIAEGSITVVCCLMTPDGLSKTQIPANLRELFQKHQ
ncbi:Thioesterase superfamily protein [Rubripirellula lacrimiformis]|uniref:Thioesterase superfamily protein n=2 Tax=Rubripirellula lacrimiformis TaxID=1930273 RepID=A0A517NAE0_9BACT|nr:Thioesterase superfamily protein [Rubripirellula lacrimiformis]